VVTTLNIVSEIQSWGILRVKPGFPSFLVVSFHVMANLKGLSLITGVDY
jgi:hypothetical protein